MTDAELIEKIATEVMGWMKWETPEGVLWCKPNGDRTGYSPGPGDSFTSRFNPLLPNGQVEMVIDRMRELGWYLSLIDCRKQWEALYDQGKVGQWRKYAMDPNRLKAICLAALAAVEGEKG